MPAADRTAAGRGPAGWPLLLLRLGRAGAGQASGTLSVWLAWERLTRWWWGVRPIRPGGILCYNVARYRGPATTLADGTPIRPGDRLVELHLDNRALARLTTAGRLSPWSALALAARDLEALAGPIARGELGPVRALHGVTIFAQAARRLGFEVRPLPRTWVWRLVRFFLLGLLVIYHPAGWARLARLRAEVWPGEVWLSVAALSSRAPAPGTFTAA